MQDILDTAVANGDVPFVVAMLADSNGVSWSGAAGDASAGRPAGPDTVFRIFSMTKAVASVAAMMLIERGELSFDTPVAEVLPAFADLPVLEGFDGDTPILREPATIATVRHLATHTSGLAYEFWSEPTSRYLRATGAPSVLSGLRAGLDYPLAFDPGTAWAYGIGVDWLGQVIEAVDGRRIDAFCQREIFEPLGMTDTTFQPDRLDDRLADAWIRRKGGVLAPHQIAPPPHPEVYGMGHALYSTAPDYLRFLRMVLREGELDGNRVLTRSSVQQMLANHIGDVVVEPMVSTVPSMSADVELFPGTPQTHSFGFPRVERDVPGMRSAGSQGWAGVLNSHYWFDPAADLAGVVMTQSLPFAEPRFMDTYAAFERAAYAR